MTNNDSLIANDATGKGTSAHREVDTLFYDGQCPLCAGEIAQLRQTRGDSLNIIDVHDLTEGTSLLTPGETEAAPNKDQLLRVLHLRRADGVWLTSADANVAAWEGTRHGRILSALRWPIIRHAVDLVYTLWARWRYRRLYGNQFDERTHAPQQQ
ncbi:thiol-disulfide oxidoreductase DCC family protein [Congregibacter sp.]|uniref:thiol-disulfide oxidoreductase DCC family protein n=1 Tax=Congregibacter sp. TaxID=2744308 RepID=UPI00385C7E3E